MSFDNSGQTLPGWVLVWFFSTAAICTWDASFIMLRPLSLPGGRLSFLFYPYKWYVPVDQRYNDTEDAYVFAQSLLNYVEVVLNVVCIIMHYKRSRLTVVTTFTVSVMTFWKTVLYFLMLSEFCTGGVYRQGNTTIQEFFLVFLPNVVWIVLPLAAMWVLLEHLTPRFNIKHVSVHTGHTTSPAKYANGHSGGHISSVDAMTGKKHF